MSTNSHQTGHEGTADSSSLRTESGSNVSDGSESSLATIISIRSDAESIHGKIEAFTSGKSSKEYKYLEEMMIRHLCKLDSVEANGDEAIRQKRKDAVNYIQSCLDQLELKAFANETQIE
ncbi:BAG3 [Bugula neritina]|nr:BAG3 [Bugula neritina]